MKKERLRILFVCVENARRSQMAQGFAETLGQRKIEVYSAGSSPSPQIDPLVIEVMKEKGVDLSTKRPKGLKDLPLMKVDYLVKISAQASLCRLIRKTFYSTVVGVLPNGFSNSACR